MKTSHNKTKIEVLQFIKKTDWQVYIQCYKKEHKFILTEKISHSISYKWKFYLLKLIAREVEQPACDSTRCSLCLAIP